ncbi:hypothetical protein [Caldimonas tepidiphila]|uniref:hypothetical protein n=1 Tax=Caldimonas tepidiphila TaxID=2315841 RepID=UPI000E5A1DCF|nr:hypothetical protein [Caldimonas tepidiphila]
MSSTPQKSQILSPEGYDLPPEAGDINDPRFDPQDGWLRDAPPELQIRAMRRWFAMRYQDPAISTPHDDKGDYLYVEDGPYRPKKVLGKRFGEVVDEAVIDELAEMLRQEVGDEWAPRNDDPGISS